MSGRLQDKIAIITGAGTGIGEAIARKFAKESEKVVVVGLPDDAVQDVAERINRSGGEAEFVAGDITEEAHAQAAVQAAIDKCSRLDILVNNAGQFLTQAEVDKYPNEDFDKTVRNNLLSVFLMTRFAIPHLQKTRGNIVSAGSEAGFNGQPNNTPYGGTKAFIHSFMMGVAVEQAKHGVRANCVCPGAIDTAWTHSKTGPMDKQMEKMTVQAEALRRRGPPKRSRTSTHSSPLMKQVTSPEHCGLPMAASPPQRVRSATTCRGCSSVSRRANPTWHTPTTVRTNKNYTS